MRGDTSDVKQTVDLRLRDLNEVDVETLIQAVEAGLERIQGSAPGMGIGGFNTETAREMLRLLRRAKTQLSGKPELVTRRSNAVESTA